MPGSARFSVRGLGFFVAVDAPVRTVAESKAGVRDLRAYDRQKSIP